MEKGFEIQNILTYFDFSLFLIPKDSNSPGNHLQKAGLKTKLYVKFFEFCSEKNEKFISEDLRLKKVHFMFYKLFSFN